MPFFLTSKRWSVVHYVYKTNRLRIKFWFDLTMPSCLWTIFFIRVQLVSITRSWWKFRQSLSLDQGRSLFSNGGNRLRCIYCRHICIDRFGYCMSVLFKIWYRSVYSSNCSRLYIISVGYHFLVTPERSILKWEKSTKIYI